MNRSACTIVSANYLPYARTLCESFLSVHPDADFFVLLVDRLPQDFEASKERFTLILVEDLGIPNFQAVAFKYGIVELNTNVKPTFMKRLLSRGIDQLIYFDPDIYIYSPVDSVFGMLDSSTIVLTPHCTSPNTGDPYSELLLLVNGVFNLGFVAVSNTPEARRFLDWWEDRCLTNGYIERWSGLFVDQKWINLVPCYFDSVAILKDFGCNVAYWNLHERILTKGPRGWVVNGEATLIFFHFSGVSVDGGKRISKHTDQFNLDSRPELKDLFDEYRACLTKNGIHKSTRHSYMFGKYNNGEPINNLQRAALAANLDKFGAENPFDVNGSFYRWARKRGLQGPIDSVGKFGRSSYNKADTRIRLVNTMLRMALRMLGADRYTILMKYFEYASVLRNQNDIFTGGTRT